MKRLASLACAIALAIIPSAALAQTAADVRAPAGFAPMQAPCSKQTDGSCLPVSTATPLPVGGKQESLTLVSANVPVAAVGVYGGTYVLSQSCAVYGTLTLQTMAPDGTTWMTLLSKTAADSAGGTPLAIGSSAVMRATVSGTTGCNALLARIP